MLSLELLAGRQPVGLTQYFIETRSESIRRLNRYLAGSRVNLIELKWGRIERLFKIVCKQELAYQDHKSPLDKLRDLKPSC